MPLRLTVDPVYCIACRRCVDLAPGHFRDPGAGPTLPDPDVTHSDSHLRQAIDDCPVGCIVLLGTA